MPLAGTVEKFDHQYDWEVQGADFQRASFKSCSEIRGEVAKVEHHEGGSKTMYKEAGRVTFPDVTLERGVTSDYDLYNWFKQVVNVGANTGLNSPAYKRDIDIVQFNRDGSEAKRWTLVGAWPSQFQAGAWSDSDEVVIENVVLTYDYFRNPAID